MHLRVLGIASLLLTLVAAGCVSSPSPGAALQKGVLPDGQAPDAFPPWASPSAAHIRPGVPIHTPQRDCASNFVFTRPDNRTVFLGSTAYCFRDMPVGTLVTIGGPDNIGVLVYSSYEAMAEVHEQDADAREYNDFAVVYVESSVRDQVSPSILQLGGPTAPADPTDVPLGAHLRAFVNDTGAADALVTGRVGAWAILAHMAPPATPGHMGGPVVDATNGRALGVIVNVGAIPDPGANGIARLDKLMAYANEHGKLPMRLETADFMPSGPLGSA